jgi:hypothetical protein
MHEQLDTANRKERRQEKTVCGAKLCGAKTTGLFAPKTPTRNLCPPSRETMSRVLPKLDPPQETSAFGSCIRPAKKGYARLVTNPDLAPHSSSSSLLLTLVIYNDEKHTLMKQAASLFCCSDRLPKIKLPQNPQY